MTLVEGGTADPLGVASTGKYFFARNEPPLQQNDLMAHTELWPLVSMNCYRMPALERRTVKPQPERKAIVFFHGNGEWAGGYAHRSDMPIPTLGECLRCISAAIGVECILAEYRGYGGSGGQPSIRALLEDAVKLSGLLYHLDIARENMVVMGRSIGSIPALELARQFPRSLGGVVLESAMDDPARAYVESADVRMPEHEPSKHGGEKPTPKAQPVELDHPAILAAYHGSVTILHAQDDETHPIAMARNLHAAALRSSEGTKLGNTSTLVEFDGGGHNYIFPLNWSVYADALLLAVGRQLGPRDWRHLSDRELMEAAGWIEDGGWWDGSLTQSLTKLGVNIQPARRCTIS
eukprot:TRINITY_DN57171_c0_g1_i1.p1 TRINITY_DN57171_c0_g1~~TRINITY_DN57171_c0_g1_i1.p1  ORF type:complete len:350 (+),score=41.44 TRINITY_DN57171_c0_g1_i1:50-1099(+)